MLSRCPISLLFAAAVVATAAYVEVAPAGASDGPPTRAILGSVQSPVAPEAWVEYIGSDPADLTPQGARGVVMQSAPNEGGYLVNFEGTGGGFYSEGAFRTIATPTFDPRESVWVSIEQGEWVVRVGGYSGERAGSFSELHEAIAFGRAIAVDEARELAWLSADGRRIDRESPSAG